MSTEEQLAAIAAHWAKTDEYARDAEVARSEAERLDGLADESEAKASEIIDAVLVEHPEWKDTLRWDRALPTTEATPDA